MLRHLSIRHFAIVESLDIDLSSGMTAITGETGAGKSIMLDALALVLGGRADSSVVPVDQERAEIAATIDLARYPAAQKWLQEQQLDGSDETDCLLRRIITREGRSQAWINGRPVALQQLKALGSQLIDIHSQHEHQSLLQKETHRHLLDAFGACQSQGKILRELYQQWKLLEEQITGLSNQGEENNARLQLLRYQIEELDQLGLQPNELQQLDQEQKQLANAEDLLSSGQQLLSLCEQSSDDSPAIMELLDQALHVLANQKIKTKYLQEAGGLIENARIQMQEACNEIEQHQSSLEMDPERLQEVEQRLVLVHQIARKHRIAPEKLLDLHQQLQEEVNSLCGGEVDLSMLQARQTELFKQYQQIASELSQLRQAAASQLNKAINKQLKNLNMAGSEFSVLLTARVEPVHTQSVYAHGNEQIEFYIRTNPGQPLMPLKKVASGGELSRVSLAIQVVTAQTSVIPTLIFDEVDVGIGGDTAAVVGQLLRTLGEKGQVICVTHQAAVAAKAHHHITASKVIAKGKVKTALLVLDNQQRVEEVARMLGGVQNQASCAHAQTMLEQNQISKPQKSEFRKIA